MPGELARVHQRRQRGWNRVERIVRSVPLLELDRVPDRLHVPRVSRVQVPEHMRVAPDQLLRNSGDHIGPAEIAAPPRDLGVKRDLQQQVPELVGESVGVL